MLPYFKKLIFLLLAFLLFSCERAEKSDFSAYGENMEKIMRTSQGIFRGLSLGMDLKNVKSIEKTGLIEEDSGYLYYEIPLDRNSSFNLSYDFDEKGLKEIQSDVFLKDEIQFNDLLNNIRMYFDNKYGKAEIDNGFWVWAKKTEKEGNIKITLTDESDDFQFNKLSLAVYNADY